MINGCSDGIVALAFVGGIFLYILIGAFVSYLINLIFNELDSDEEEILIVFCVVLWPLVLIACGIYTIGRWITVPLWAATKRDIERVNNRINKECSMPLDLSDYVAEPVNYLPSFKVGDLITGRIPQTDRYGKNISYEHLYQGCKCRVLRISDKDSMKVILIDHKDKEAHKFLIGETFTAPARNFVLVKKVANKRRVVKRKKSKR